MQSLCSCLEDTDTPPTSTVCSRECPYSDQIINTWWEVLSQEGLRGGPSPGGREAQCFCLWAERRQEARGRKVSSRGHRGPEENKTGSGSTVPHTRVKSARTHPWATIQQAWESWLGGGRRHQAFIPGGFWRLCWSSPPGEGVGRTQQRRRRSPSLETILRWWVCLGHGESWQESRSSARRVGCTQTVWGLVGCWWAWPFSPWAVSPGINSTFLGFVRGGKSCGLGAYAVQFLIQKLILTITLKNSPSFK